ncbi:hypothetical protein GOBAR_AA05652 [Gossypium barbadense]|uniref:Uncharacterized protein n=1 Tax=Gossypium barbadense TaxID=3634 RepID=A0A2P5YH79_GOSBA|nr:hypothetical protein GOBAR_AA05652 [Gossypium barbadense]
MYREGRYNEALGYYTEALAVAKTKPQKIALHTEECTSVLELDHKHTGALMLRAQTLVTLKEYNSALFDVNQLIELDPSSEVYHNLQARLRTQLEDLVVPAIGKDLNAAELNEYPIKEKIIPSEKSEVKEYAEQETDCKNMPERNPGVTALQKPNDRDSKGYQAIPKPKEYSGQKNVPQRVGVASPLGEGIKDSKGWQAIPKPKGHSALDYARQGHHILQLPPWFEFFHIKVPFKYSRLPPILWKWLHIRSSFDFGVR